MQTKFKETILDEQDREITVGTRVKLWNEAELLRPESVQIAQFLDTKPHSTRGVVVEITDPDDAGPDDEGRSVPIAPRVYVKWDGEDDREPIQHGPDHYKTGWSTSFDHQEMVLGEEGAPMPGDAYWRCEELEVVT